MLFWLGIGTKSEKGVRKMKISYNKLQKLMADNQMKRSDLMRVAEFSPYAAT